MDLCHHRYIRIFLVNLMRLIIAIRMFNFSLFTAEFFYFAAIFSVGSTRHKLGVELTWKPPEKVSGLCNNVSCDQHSGNNCTSCILVTQTVKQEESQCIIYVIFMVFNVRGKVLSCKLQQCNTTFRTQLGKDGHLNGSVGKNSSYYNNKSVIMCQVYVNETYGCSVDGVFVNETRPICHDDVKGNVNKQRDINHTMANVKVNCSIQGYGGFMNQTILFTKIVLFDRCNKSLKLSTWSKSLWDRGCILRVLQKRGIRVMKRDVNLNKTSKLHLIGSLCKNSNQCQCYIGCPISERYYCRNVAACVNSSWILPNRCILGQLNSPQMGATPNQFSFDDYEWVRWILLTLTIFFQFFLPIFHTATRNGKGQSFRVLSLHSFFAFYAWLSFYICCTVLQCHRYGQIMHDLTIFCNVMLPICYLILVSESCVSAELLSITNVLVDISLTDYIESLRKTNPGRFCIVKCYEYGWFHKRVLSYKESRLFSVEYSIDLSEDPPIKARGITRLRLSMDVDFGDKETAGKYKGIETELVNAMSNKGSSISVGHHDFIPGFHDIICGYADQAPRPFWMSPSLYVIISIIGLSWPYR